MAYTRCGRKSVATLWIKQGEIRRRRQEEEEEKGEEEEDEEGEEEVEDDDDGDGDEEKVEVEDKRCLEVCESARWRDVENTERQRARGWTRRRRRPR